jgi:hypothetical protein
MLRLAPITVEDANRYIRLHHRHHPPVLRGVFAVSVVDASSVRGVAIYGRPVARGLHDGWTAEVTRVATDGAGNACSMLYGACWRSWRARGGGRMVTYTLAEEAGASLRGAGWVQVASVRGRSWSCPSRPRTDRHPTTDKRRWEVTQPWYQPGMPPPPSVPELETVQLSLLGAAV